MFNRLHTYAVYVKRDAPEPLNTVVFVREGFSVWALLFHMLWAAYHGMWRIAALIFAFYGITAVLDIAGLLPGHAVDMLHLGLGLWLGLDAAELRGADLRRRGYLLYEVMRGVDEEDATSRFVGGIAA